MPHPSDINVYIHIGLHKTGSTTLQSFLSRNESALLEMGYLYPVAGRGRTGSDDLMMGHHNLAWQLRKEADHYSRALGSWDDLVEEIEGGEIGNVILSSEDFDTVSPEAISEIGRLLSRQQVRIIIYVRRQDLAIQSAYGGDAKRGLYLKDFQSYIERQISRETRLRYDTLLEPWENQFGLKNLTVRPLENGQLRGDLCLDFLYCAGMDADAAGAMSAVPDRNASPGLKTLNAARLATRIMRLVSADFRQHGKCMKAVQKYAETNNWNEKKLRLISTEDHQRILAEFRDSNAAVARKYLSRDDGRLFLEEFDDDGLSEFDTTDFSDEEILDLISIVVDHRR